MHRTSKTIFFFQKSPRHQLVNRLCAHFHTIFEGWPDIFSTFIPRNNFSYFNYSLTLFPYLIFPCRLLNLIICGGENCGKKMSVKISRGILRSTLINKSIHANKTKCSHRLYKCLNFQYFKFENLINQRSELVFIKIMTTCVFIIID